MLTSVQCPHASPSPQGEHSTVLFTQHDQCPSTAASDMSSFGGSDNELDDSLSLVASDAEVLSVSVTDPALLPLSSSCNTRPRTDKELVHVMTKAVSELGLEWSPPEVPSHSRLHEWFLPGCHQSPRQRSSPFFPEVQDKVTKSWRALYSSHIRPSAFSALTSIDSAEEKGYKNLSPLDESMDRRRGQAIRPSRAEPLLHSLDAPTLQLDKRLRRCTLWLCSRSSRPRCSPVRRPVLMQLHSGTWPYAPPRPTTQAIGWSMSSLVVLESHLWFTLVEMNETDKVPFLDAPVSSNSLFGPAEDGFVGRINTRSFHLGCPWLPALLHDTWMQLSPLCDRWEPASSTTSTTGSFWPSQRQFQHCTRPSSSATLPGAQGQLCQEHTVTQPTFWLKQRVPSEA